MPWPEEDDDLPLHVIMLVRITSFAVTGITSVTLVGSKICRSQS